MIRREASRPRAPAHARDARARRAAGWGVAALVGLSLGSAAPSARGHDWWIEPSSGRVAAGERVDLVTKVGVAFAGDRVARDPARIVRFEWRDREGVRAVEGSPGDDPAGRFVARDPGLAVVVYHSQPARVYLRAPDFEKYLHEEGLETVVARRRERGESERMGLEQYERCAKALIAVGAAEGDEERAVGLPLEIVLLLNPARLVAPAPPGAPPPRLPVRLTFRGEPVAGAQLQAFERGRAAEVGVARTDADGRASFELPHPGLWMVKGVHMIETPPDVKAATRLDWWSFWASSTFEVAPAR